MNDCEAIKKKIRAERRTNEVSLKESKNGSNVTIALRASLFEFVKSNFIQDIQNNTSIVEVKNAEGVKVSSEGSCEAFGEDSVQSRGLPT